MKEYESKEIYHQVQLGRVENGFVKKCLLTLEKANKDISDEIKKTTNIGTKERYKEIQKYLKKVSKELKKKVNKNMDVDEFIDYELNAQIKLYKKYGNIQFIAPSKEQIVSSVMFSPYTNTSTFENYLDALEVNFYNVWDSCVRTGYLNGFTTDTIVKNVVGSVKDKLKNNGEIHALRQSVEKNTRTALQNFAMETHRMIYEANADIIDGYKWYATLDRRTCIICGKLDGEVHQRYEDFGETPTVHFQCRCVILPQIKGYDELKDIRTRSSESGQVSDKVTFDDWLESQSEDVQKDVLGEYRYKLFKDGTSINSFINDGQILTVQELQELGV